MSLIAGLVIGSVTIAAAADLVPAKRWATSVCKALGQWEKSVAARAKPTKEQADPKTGRAVLAKYLSGIVKDTNALVKRLDAAESPDVDHGTEIATAVQDAFAEALASVRDAKRQVAKLDVSSADNFGSGATVIQQSIADAFGAAQSALTQAGAQYSVPALTSALSATRSCQALVGTP